MELPWDKGLTKQIKDIFMCIVLECEPIKIKEELNDGKGKQDLDK